MPEKLAEGAALLVRQRFRRYPARPIAARQPGAQHLPLAPAQSGHLPIVVITGLADECVALDAVAEGAQFYLIEGRTPPSCSPAQSAGGRPGRKQADEELSQVKEELSRAKEAAEAAEPGQGPHPDG